MEIKKLVELKNAKKAKKPTFLRQDAHKKDKLADNWRRPKGKDSKMRKGFRGKRRSPSMGFSSPRLVRGFNRDGFKEVLVNNVNELNSVDPKNEMVIVGSIGTKKKVEVLKKCEELKIKISNVKDVKKFLDDVKKKQEDKKKVVKERVEKKKAKEETAKKVKKEAKKEEVKEEASKEETKKGEKSEKIKVLEKKQ